MTGVLGARIAVRSRTPFCFDIRDIFAETIEEVLPGIIGRVARAASSTLESYAIRRAARVNLVSEGFLEYFSTRYPGISYSCISNGIDDEFLNAVGRTPGRPPYHATGTPVRVVYAGNVGEGQGLDRILPGLAKALRGRATFVVIGDGGKRQRLEEVLVQAGVDNVTLLPPMSRTELISEYQSADALLLHLNDYAAFRRVLPSKVFEYGALGKPILAGVAGFAAEFIRRELPDAELFRPCDLNDAVEAFGRLTFDDRCRRRFIERFSRAVVSDRLADLVLETARMAPRG